MLTPGKRKPTETESSFIDLCRDLSNMVAASGEAFDYLITEGLSGAAVTNIMARRLNMLNRVLFANTLWTFDEFGNKTGLVFLQPMPESVAGKSGLLVASASKSGSTLKAITEHLTQEDRMARVGTAVLDYFAPEDGPAPSLVPDFSVTRSKTDPTIFRWVEHNGASVHLMPNPQAVL